ncbi:MAG: ATP-binding cassette domain-containing protein [Candidatus Lokiarchaeota archaeon]|nr:ATP-binding cassette domain-containing protein [Candidatus Lokiarchaeota archaeon]MBD3202572.1 ATP-binding cassette domain-containing protein [Candidatus Lokiarchaeota archaeon]
MLKLENVYKTYDLGKTKVRAVNGISLTIKNNSFFSIMGPSGSGKTTLLNLIGALDTPTKGKISINGKNLNDLSDKALTQLRRFEIGFIFQSFNLIPVLSCFENIELPLIVAGVNKEKRKKRVDYLLEKVELEAVKQHKPSQLSGGQKQRVAIARALVNQPSIVLADELTGDLDSKTGERIMNFLEKLHLTENQTIIVVTHDINIANKTDRIYKIKDGKLID